MLFFYKFINFLYIFVCNLDFFDKNIPLFIC